MDKVYVVTGGIYSDYRIRAIFTKRSDAEAYIAATDTDEVGIGDDPRVEQWPLDRPHDEWIGISVHIAKDGTIANQYLVTEDYRRYPLFDMTGSLITTVWTTDLERATKVANERRVALLAAGQWQDRRENQ